MRPLHQGRLFEWGTCWLLSVLAVPRSSGRLLKCFLYQPPSSSEPVDLWVGNMKNGWLYLKKGIPKTSLKYVFCNWCGIN